MAHRDFSKLTANHLKKSTEIEYIQEDEPKITYQTIKSNRSWKQVEKLWFNVISIQACVKNNRFILIFRELLQPIPIWKV